MNTNLATDVSISSNTANSVLVSSFEKLDRGHACMNLDPDTSKEGFLERWGLNEQWHRYWCVLCNDCLCCYLTHTEKMPIEVIELTGYDITLAPGHFQGKQFILRLEHLNCTRVILSTKSLEECQEWYQAIKSVLSCLIKTTIIQEPVIQANMSQINEAVADKTESTSAETVKQKLLAEVLRQKLELEKLQATRAGSKGEVQAAEKRRSASPTLGTSVVTDDDKTCLLTRLTQRRMSTQIKLNAVHKQLEASSNSFREKKIIFQLGKKKPDVVQGHLDNDNRRPELENQARTLSSKLQELDTCLLSHGSASPTIQTRARIRGLRHSYDQNLLKKIQLAGEAGRDVCDEVDSDYLPKQKEKFRDVNRSVSIKTSVQKFAHKTFAKANWYLNKKSTNLADERDGNKLPSYLQVNSLSDLRPDVIDVTKNGKMGNKLYTLHGPGISEPLENSQSEHVLGNRTLPGCHKTGFSNKTHEEILSKLLFSPSFTNLNRCSTQIKTSTSSPCLSKLSIKQQKETWQMLNTPPAISIETKEDIQENKTLSELIVTRDHDSLELVPQKRQVSASTLAEIEAFEELSMKFLGNDSKSKS